MIESINPGFFLILSGILLFFVRKRMIRDSVLIFVPLFVLFLVFNLKEGEFGVFRIANYELITLKIDSLSLIFSYVFALITLFGNIYALHVEDRGHHFATMIYSGSSFGVIFAGDWITLFIFWELMAIFSTFVIWYGKKTKSLEAGFRYLIFHLFGSAFLLAGIILSFWPNSKGTIEKIVALNFPSSLILIGFLVNAACPPLHPWLPDAYPEAHPAGTVFLSAYTTKSAVYALLRVFPGIEILAWLGALMALYGVVYAVIENNLRRLLSYHIVSQVGYMVCGVGLGTSISMDGSVAHAFCHILYKALLLMGVGSVIFATGKEKISEVEGLGLYSKIPFTFYFYMVGAFSISGIPLFSGFVSKPMIVYASAELKRPIINTLLHLASVGTFLSVALKLPYGTWLRKKSSCSKAQDLNLNPLPFNTYFSMFAVSLLCLIIGIYPDLLYKYLPYNSDFRPYTAYHVITTLQLFFFVLLAFIILKKRVSAEAKLNIDIDWFYRKCGLMFLKVCGNVYAFRSLIQSLIQEVLKEVQLLGLNPVNLKRVFLSKKTKPAKTYDPDIYRHPVGLGISIFLALYVIMTLILLFFL